MVRPDAGCTEVEFLWTSGHDGTDPDTGDDAAEDAADDDSPRGIGPERFGQAEVFLEASRHTFWQRHSVGRAADLAERASAGEPVRLDFDEFDSLEGVRFRLKVTGRTETDRSRLLAVAGPLRVAGLPDEIEGRSLLPIASDDLGERPYRLLFDDGGPLLMLNERLGPKEVVAVDPAFVSLALPAAIGQIASRLLADSAEMPDAELRSADDWRADWFGFLRDRLRAARPQPDDDADDWVDEVVERFCRHHRMTGRLLASAAWTADGETDD